MELRLADDEDEDYDENDLDGPLSAEHQELAKRIAADERFDGFGGPVSQRLIDESGLDLNPDVSFRVEMEAQEIFERATGAQLEREARGIVRQLVEHPDFDPLVDKFWKDEGYPYIDEALIGKDVRLKRLVLEGLQYEVSELGLDDKAEREVKKEAARLRSNIPQLVLDQVGFASRKAARAVLLAPFLDAVVEKRREIVAEWIQRLEGERSAARREARYGVAAQRLWVGTATKKAIAAKLQISTSTFERLLGIRIPAGFEFEPGDPIIVDLAPELSR